MSIRTVVAQPRSRSAVLADAAVSALVAEAELTPKPGLVDSRNNGAHADMDVALLVRSAWALRETFEELADAAVAGPFDSLMRTRLAEIGRAGEARMLATTRGVNTHRGAIWALGLCVAGAASGAGPGNALQLLTRVSHLAGQPDLGSKDSVDLRNGELARMHYAVPGAVGNAQQGFPAAVSALTTLTTLRAAGVGERAARIGGLLSSMAILDDTCILHRGGWHGLRFVRAGAAAVLATGLGADEEWDEVTEFDRNLSMMGLSPGGSADMLAVALFLDDITPSTGEEYPCKP